MSRLHARRSVLAVGVSLALILPIAAAAAPAALASGSGRTTFVVLSRGDTGPRVALVQRALSVKPVNGHFNDRTRHAVRQFQGARGIAVTGVVNSRTMNSVEAKWANIQAYRQHLRQKYHRIMQVARNQKGDPYVYGAAGPNAFDCSGYTMYVYAHATNIQLQHLAGAQFREGHQIHRKQARPGDLVFMHSGSSIYHAAIYAGHNRVWEASRPGTRIHRDRIWTNQVYFARMFPKH